MGGSQSLQERNVEDVLKFFKEELKKWNDTIKNLEETWKSEDKSWVPAYLRQQMEETEVKWSNVKSLIPPGDECGSQFSYPADATNISCSCQQILKQKDDEIIQLKKNNEKLLQSNQTTELELKNLKEKTGELQPLLKECPSRREETPSKSSLMKTSNSSQKQSETPELKPCQNQTSDVLSQPENKFIKKMIDFEEKSEKEKAELKTENDKLSKEKTDLEDRMKHLEKEIFNLKTRNQEELESPSKPKTECEKEKRQNEESLQQSSQLSDKNQCDINNTTEEMLRKQASEIEEKYLTEKSKNEKLVSENDDLKERIKDLQKETEEVIARNKEISEKATNCEKETQKKRNEALAKIEELRKRNQQTENDRLALLEEKDTLNAQKDTLEIYANQLKAEKDELLLRLSKMAGDKLVDNNPGITDLSDSNRPTKLGEFYSEIYDNEWTNAFEALVEGGYDEITAIETLRLTLQNVLQFCESKANRLLKKASDAVNLLFEEYQQSVLERRIPSAATMPKQQARDVGQFLSQKSTLEDIKLQRMWKPKLNSNSGGAKKCSEKVQKEEHTKLDADKKLKQLRKDMATSMVPIVQKAYIEASWTNGCIDDLKPYILKCLYLGWMMVVQSPPLVLHTYPCVKEIKFDKNLYKEYTASGPFVKYVVWPALLLEENGPLVCKGVAEGKKT